MAYFKPYIDDSGLHIPGYVDTRDDLIARAKQIFGEDIYIGPEDPDAQDYELISVFSDKIHDVFQLAQLLYNNRGPSTAVGDGLGGIVKQNGIRRKPETHSTCPVILQAKPNEAVRLAGGIVGDEDGHMWDIGDIEIAAGEELEVAATCTEAGAIYADAGSINRIIKQTRGLLSVRNEVNATPGKSIENDAELRSRQAISTARPSRTVLTGTVGGIAEILDVTRYRVYENDTNVFGYYGPPIPEHTICAIVEGGKAEDIAQEIYLRKTPGCGTHGDIEVDVLALLTSTESNSVANNSIVSPPIRFFRPSYVDVYVEVVIRPQTGYVDHIGQQIQQNICDYLNALDIGENLTTTALFAPIYSATPNIQAPAFSAISLHIGKSRDDLSGEDMDIQFNEVTRGNLAYIRIVEV